MAKSTKAPAAKTAESVQVRKTKVYTIPQGGGVLFRIPSDAIAFDSKTGLNRKANGGEVFLEVNTESNAQKDLDTEFLLHDAVSMVRSKSMSDLLPIAIYLNMDTNQKNSELKRELLLEAKANPKNFIGLFDNPTVKVRSVVKKCVDFQILNSKPEGMYWFDSNRFIIATPSGQDTVSVMTQFCLTEKGSLVFETIKEELAKAEA
mgnify:CR=1 FL=1